MNHPNIITIHDIAQEDGVDFIIMEYVAGRSLSQLIAGKGGALRTRLSDLLKYAVQIADALAAAHEAGIIHRDLKPGNVMVTDKGLVKVLDFGLAKLTEPRGPEEATATARTEEGVIVGTVAYMSPEQAQGQQVDARSDIFSFGAVLYEMVTSRAAFHGDTRLSTLAAIINQEPKPLPAEIPGDLEKLITRCLRKDPARRFQHMDDVKVALEELKDESDLGKLAPAPVMSRRRRRVLAWASGLFVVVILAGAGWWLLSPPETPAVELRVTPLTSYPGMELYPSFSTDGNQVAFAWNGEKRDNWDIYVKLVGPGAPLRLTTHAAQDYCAAWSPDGRQIAFLRSEGTQTYIYLISPLGGPERRLAGCNPTIRRSLAWSPDGKWLALGELAEWRQRKFPAANVSAAVC